MTFIKNLSWRYATKKFDGKKIPADVLEQILNAVRMAPSSFGIQPYHVIVIENPEIKKVLEPLAWHQKQIMSCSHLLVFSAITDMTKRTEEYLSLADKERRTDLTHDPKYDYKKQTLDFVQKMGAEWATKQAYIALGFGLAACAELGVDSCPMEGFDPNGFKTALKLPNGLEPKVLLAIGHRSPDDLAMQKVRFGKDDLFDFR